MKRLTSIMIACLCAFIGLPSAFAATKYKEAPVLAALVKAGKLPTVEKRLPENPLVVPGDAIGQYGGVWRRAFLGPADFNNYVRVVYDAWNSSAPATSATPRSVGRTSPTGSSSATAWRAFSGVHNFSNAIRDALLVAYASLTPLKLGRR